MEFHPRSCVSVPSTAALSSSNVFAFSKGLLTVAMTFFSFFGPARRIVLGRFQGPFPLAVAHTAALKCSYRSDSVTRD